MFKRLVVVVCFSLCMHLCLSQTGGVVDPGNYGYNVKDCFRDSVYKRGFKGSSIKMNNVLKGQQLWRTISLSEPQNSILFNTNDRCELIGLFEIIKFGLIELHLNAFSSDDFGRSNLFVLKPADIVNSMIRKDSSAALSFDENGNEVSNSINEIRYLMGSDVKYYLMKEDWILNNYSGKMEKHIIAIAPLVDSGVTGVTAPLFWLYYAEWKDLFAAFRARNFYNYDSISFDDLFMKRFFISQISKETNLFDRAVKSVHHGTDAYLESERIKEKLNSAESDLFSH